MYAAFYPIYHRFCKLCQLVYRVPLRYNVHGSSIMFCSSLVVVLCDSYDSFYPTCHHCIYLHDDMQIYNNHYVLQFYYIVHVCMQFNKSNCKDK